MAAVTSLHPFPKRKPNAPNECMGMNRKRQNHLLDGSLLQKRNLLSQSKELPVLGDLMGEENSHGLGADDVKFSHLSWGIQLACVGVCVSIQSLASLV